MKRIKIILILLIFLSTLAYSQEIGKLAPEKPPEEFPPNSWGVDLMFGEGGFGIGTFFRKEFNTEMTGFIDLSFSESKDEREFQYIDYWGNTFTVGKINRVFLIPVNIGLQYRLFSTELTSNLRPYVNFGVGPTLILSTPYEQEFFSAFGDAETKFAVGGYVGFGANFGSSKSNLIGINLRYYYMHLFDEGVENLRDRFRKDIAHFYLTINIGIMY
ncbi:MAG: hypothetical protein QY331_03770 [Melioribacteraceae bacterium]|jgi:hypothetical protein|nr:hypothetical protein [Melioribacteraceae bacterium]RJP58034.1 MAG: hypothetical protein C4543_08780 [Ignavibacteriales bacterium]WKZ70374.1 MAG: hypothetical protein QY331_03770 [Melioribacteraceae bacterium]